MSLTTGNQLKAARALAGINQTELSERAGVNVNTIRNMEGRGAETLVSGLDTVRKVQFALEALGVIFLDEGETTKGGPGVRLSGLGLPSASAQNRTEGNDNQSEGGGERRKMNE